MFSESVRRLCSFSALSIDTKTVNPHQKLVKRKRLKNLKIFLMKGPVFVEVQAKPEPAGFFTRMRPNRCI